MLDKMRRVDPAPVTPQEPATVTDPVCGMTFAPRDAAATSRHGGRTLHFCAAGCKKKFDAAPGHYA